jgi:anti-sigma B factor antagonist
VSERERGPVESLRVEAQREGDRVVVTLSGELDLASAPLLQSEIEQSIAAGAGEALVLDLDGLQFIDSTGLRVILAGHDRAREEGREFAVTRGSKQVQRLLSITRAGEHLRVVESPDELLV